MMSIMAYTADLSVQLLQTIDRHKFHTLLTLGQFLHLVLWTPPKATNTHGRFKKIV